FPIKAGGKSPPLISEWPDRATSDAKKIESWWIQWPNANPGISCGGLLVVDCDERKNGYDSLEKFEKEISLPESFEVETPNGRHIYYRCEETLRNGVDILGPGLDVRTTSAGYVVGAGARTAAGEYRILVDRPIVDAPVNLVTHLRAPVRE